MSPASIGINLRVTGHCSQGGRKYMEDFFSVAYQQSEDEKDLEYAFFGIFDGHGGSEAAKFAKEHLMNEIVNQKLFWSDIDDDVLRAIREGYIQTHYAMWRKQEKWPKTTTGLPSTAGTTASVAFIRKGKIYIGHVGDSGIVLGYQENGEKCWKTKPLTQDHKPECHIEKARIMNSGGKVVTKSGVPRVVWNRPRVGHKGPVRRSTPFDEIPFLAVARSLGDLWSYNSALNQFVVSPDPDVCVVKIDPKTFRCLIFGTDGLWNVISSNDSIEIARDAEIVNERLAYMSGGNALSNDWRNPSKCLVDKALERWSIRKMRADNTSVVTVMLDPPGLPKKDISRQCSTTSYGLEYIQMDGEINSHDDDYRTISNTNIHNSEQYSNMTTTLSTNNHLLHHHHHQNLIMQNCYSQSQNPSCDYSSVLQRYDNNSCDNFSYYDNNSIMDNSSSNYVFESCSSSSTPTTSNHNNQQQQQQHNQPDMYSNGISFAESYNSLLISSLENENSSSRSSSSDSSGDESDVQHIYQSLNETGLAGHDHVYRHYPNIHNQQQQQQYQQACMLDEDGYSLTKLETRCEQRLRNINSSYICGTSSSSSNLNNNNSNFKNSLRVEQQQQQSRQITFQNHNDNCQINSSTTNYNQYDNITSSFRSTNTNLHNEQDTNNYIAETTKFDEPPPQQGESNVEQQDVILSKSSDNTERICENIINVPIKDDKTLNILDENSKNQTLIEVVLDESIQINEISSSFSEINSPLPSPSPSSCSNNNVIDYSIKYSKSKILNDNIKDIEMMDSIKPKINQNRIKTSQKSTSNITTPTTRSTRASKLLFSIKQNDENISIPETRQPIRYTKRTLRSRNSLSKDLKAKTTINKKTTTTTQHLKRSITDEYLKSVVVNSSTVVATTSLCKLRSRQQQQQKPKQVAIWPITRSRRTTTKYSIVPSTPSALCANNINNNSRLRNNNNNTTNLRNLNNTVTSSSCNTYRNNNRLHTKIVQSPSSSSSSISSTSTKRSLSSRNSAWCPGKNAVQTRNRVQKR